MRAKKLPEIEKNKKLQVIKETEDRYFKELRHFFSQNVTEIAKEMERCNSISELDFRTMLYILTMLDYKMYIPL